MTLGKQPKTPGRFRTWFSGFRSAVLLGSLALNVILWNGGIASMRLAFQEAPAEAEKVAAGDDILDRIVAANENYKEGK